MKKADADRAAFSLLYRSPTLVTKAMPTRVTMTTTLTTLMILMLKLTATMNLLARVNR
jgi:hypothetical protein